MLNEINTADDEWINETRQTAEHMGPPWRTYILCEEIKES